MELFNSLPALLFLRPSWFPRFPRFFLTKNLGRFYFSSFVLDLGGFEMGSFAFLRPSFTHLTCLTLCCVVVPAHSQTSFVSLVDFGG